MSKVLPDLLVCPSSGAPPVLMVEVQSQDFAQATRRLYLELYIHLIILRSRIPHVKKSSGFVDLKNDLELGTVMATVTWEPNLERFGCDLELSQVVVWLQSKFRIIYYIHNILYLLIKSIAVLNLEFAVSY